jgi:hypothetical protein
VPGTDVVTVATFDLISEAVGRPEDFSSNILSLLYRDGDGLPARLDFGGTSLPTLATPDPPLTTTPRRAVFPELVARRMLTLGARSSRCARQRSTRRCATTDSNSRAPSATSCRSRWSPS